jgi:hypothetical protein
MPWEQHALGNTLAETPAVPSDRVGAGTNF